MKKAGAQAPFQGPGGLLHNQNNIKYTTNTMPRPRCPRTIQFNPRVNYFKPKGIPLKELKIITLTLEEAEAIRLKYIESLDQEACAQKMDTSQSTFQRILTSANTKIADALINGKALEILNQ